MNISNRVNAIEPSLARMLFNLAKEYNDVIDLTLGDPDFTPPLNVRQAACNAIMAGKTHYSHNAGLKELRECIVNYLYRTQGNLIDLNNVAITVGGMEALFLTLSTLLNPMDEVIILAPYYVNYVQMVKLLDCIPKVINTTVKNNFQVTIEQIKKVYSQKTKIIIVNSPCNPTGVIIDYHTMQEIYNFAKEKGIIILSDEVYKSLIWSNSSSCPSFLSFGLDSCVVIDSASKQFSMTGWRIGYVIACEKIIENIIKMQENVAACASLPSQYAAIEAYSQSTNTDYIKQELANRIKIVSNLLDSSPHVSYLPPQGTFYFWVDISASKMKSLDFCIELLKHKKVAVVPGTNFGLFYDNYIRISCTVSSNVLKDGINRILEYINQIVQNS